MGGGGGGAQKRSRGPSGAADPDGPSTSAPSSSFTALHRSRMFSWKPAAVAALAACPGAPLVAAGYESGDLELWDLSIMACIQRVVGDGVEVTSLAWACDGTGRWRTFVSHLDATISEVDWQGSALKGTLDSSGGVIWDLAAQPSESVKPGFPYQLAAACDDGTVRLFTVEDDEPGAQLDRVLSVLQGRLLSCAWHPTGGLVIVGGVLGTIHMLDSTTGRELQRVTVGTSSSQPPLVWRLLVLPDGTLVSGDSEGAVQMWDAVFGTLLHRFTRHKADVLALAASPDGSAVFASGVDSQVAMFSLSEGGPVGSPGAAWAYVDYKRPHTHDVKAMDVVLAGGKAVLVSGGMDAQLVAYPADSFPKEHPVRLTKAPQRPLCQLAPAAPQAGAPWAAAPTPAPRRPSLGGGAAAAAAAAPASPRLLCCHGGVVDVWQLGCHAPVRHVSGAMWSWRQQQQPHPCEGSPVDLTSSPRHLAQIKLGGGARVACAAISPDGGFVVCCSGTGAVRLYRLYSLATAAQQASLPALGVRRVKLPADTGRAVALALTRRHLVAAHADGALSCYELPPAAKAKAGERSTEGEGEGEEQEEARLVAVWSPAESAQDRHAASAASAAGSWRQYHSQASVLATSHDGVTLAVGGTAGVTLFHLPSSEQQQPEGGKKGQQQLKGQGNKQRRGRRGAKQEDGEEEHEEGEEGRPAVAVAAKMLEQVGKPLRSQHDAPVAGLAFSPDGRLLAAVLASGHLAVYDVAATRLLQWSADNDSGVSRCLDKLPGPLSGCSFNPDPEVQQLVVFGPGGFCHFDLTRAPDLAHFDAKRRRGPLPKSAAQAAVEGRGRNGRAVLLPDPCVFATYLSVDSVVVLEKPWEDVARGFAPPLLRQRFGS